MQTELIDCLFLELSQVTKAITAKEADLAMLVRRLAHRLDTVHPGDTLSAQAKGYLERKGYNPSPLREEVGG